MRRITLCMFVFTFVFSSAYSSHIQAAELTIEEEIPKLVEKMAQQLLAKDTHKVAAIDFVDLRGRPTELGRYLAEQLSVDMVAADGITVVDRANLDAILKEHDLTAEGLVKPEDAKKLGHVSGLDAIIIGSLSSVDDSVVLMVKAISTESAEIVAAGRVKFDTTKDIQRMLGMSVNTPNASDKNGAGGATANGGDEIAIREVGAATAILRNVAFNKIKAERGEVLIPVITCTFDLENRNLKESIAIAVNGAVPTDDGIVTMNGYRGTLADSHEQQWASPKSGVKGVPSVFCFEITNVIQNDDYTQSNPTSIVNYIRSATKYDFKDKRNKEETGRYWAGSFATIPPGRSLRLTVNFLPADILANPRELPKVLRPDFFQLDIELVVGTFSEGNTPEESKNLALRNLTVDRIVLPKSDAK